MKLMDRDLGDPSIARAVGLALFERTLTLSERPATDEQTKLYLTRSFELVDGSLRVRPEDPEAIFAFASLSAALNRHIDLALLRLVPMFERLPRNPDLAAAAARLLEARGDQSTLPYVTAVYRYSHSLDQKAWAAQRIDELKKKTPLTTGE
jgi:hypothetical protein